MINIKCQHHFTKKFLSQHPDFYNHALASINNELKKKGYQPVELYDCAFYFDQKEGPKLNNPDSDEINAIIEFTAKKQSN